MASTKKTLLSNLECKPFYPTITDCKIWSQVLNQLLYHGQLPPYKKVTVRRLRGCYAYVQGEITKRNKRYCTLTIHNRFESFASFYSILCHELVHHKEFYEIGEINHGEFFYSHQEMLSILGIKLLDKY